MTKYMSIIAGAAMFLAGCQIEPRLVGVYGLLFLILLGIEDLSSLVRGQSCDYDDDDGRPA